MKSPNDYNQYLTVLGIRISKKIVGVLAFTVAVLTLDGVLTKFLSEAKLLLWVVRGVGVASLLLSLNYVITIVVLIALGSLRDFSGPRGMDDMNDIDDMDNED